VVQHRRLTVVVARSDRVDERVEVFVHVFGSPGAALNCTSPPRRRGLVVDPRRLSVFEDRHDFEEQLLSPDGELS
jgi:hypothetical protein